MTETSYTPQEHLVQMRLDRFALTLRERVDAILAEIPHEDLRQLILELAMTPNEILPKRPERPHARWAYAVFLIGRALGLDKESLDELLKMSIAFCEGGDIFDDVVDNDYREGHLHQLLAVSSSLHFVASRCALRLGPDAAAIWLEVMHELPHSLLLEKDGDKSMSTYLAAVQSQAALFGAIGHVAATAAKAPKHVVDAVVEFTKLFYTYLQYPQDLREAPKEVNDGLSMSANIMRHISVEQLATLFNQIHERMLTALEAFPNSGTAIDQLRDFVESIKPDTRADATDSTSK